MSRGLKFNNRNGGHHGKPRVNVSVGSSLTHLKCIR